MNATVRFAILATFTIGGMLLVIALFGWPEWSMKAFGTWLLFAVLGASLVFEFVRWRQMVKR